MTQSFAVTGYSDSAARQAVGTTYVKARNATGAALWAQLNRPLPWMRRAKRFVATPYRPEHDPDFLRGGVRVARIRNADAPPERAMCPYLAVEIGVCSVCIGSVCAQPKEQP